MRDAVALCDGDTSTLDALLGERDYLTACELLQDRLDDSWRELMAEKFSRPQFVPMPIHRHIFSLDLRLVLTPNFDKIYDVFAQNETRGATVVKSYHDADTPLVLRRNYRAVVKVHGSIDEPSRTVFSRGEYAKMRHDFPAFFQLMDALFLTHTFIFVGSSVADPDLRLFLENHCRNHPSAPAHFITSPQGEIPTDLDALYRRNFNLRILRYDPSSNHAELVDSLEALVARVESKRAEIASVFDW